MGAGGRPKSGTVLADRYRLVQTLGQGAMGSVWRAEHQSLGSEVAIKIIDPIIAEMDMGIERFMREARALAKLRSPHVVQVLDFGSEGEVVFLVMELLEGRNLGQRLNEDGRLSPQETLRVLTDVCKGVSHAHARGLVHRDLKPDNIFLCDQSREHVVKVLDFGIAKAMRRDHAGNATTDPGSLLGTPSYMSPEQCRNIKQLDARGDVWALGAIAYECLIGKRVYEGDVFGDLLIRICTEPLPVPSSIGPVPPGFDAWFAKALAHNPDERFQSASELAESLAAVCTDRSSLESGETLFDLSSRPAGSVQTKGSASTLVSGTVSKSGNSSPSNRRNWRVLALFAGLGILALAVMLRGQASSTLRAQSEPRLTESHQFGVIPQPPKSQQQVLPNPSRTAPDAGSPAASKRTPASLAPTHLPAAAGTSRASKPLQAAPPTTPPKAAAHLEMLRRKR